MLYCLNKSDNIYPNGVQQHFKYLQRQIIVLLSAGPTYFVLAKPNWIRYMQLIIFIKMVNFNLKKS